MPGTSQADVPHVPFSAQCGPVHIGIDSGSTTVKLVVVDEKSQILYTNYQPEPWQPAAPHQGAAHQDLSGTPRSARGQRDHHRLRRGLVKNAFRCDYGLVETVAHFTAAKYFMPDVDFIIDIGGQDMKCFKIEDGAISNIFLNEACSSGCGFSRPSRRRWVIMSRSSPRWACLPTARWTWAAAAPSS